MTPLTRWEIFWINVVDFVRQLFCRHIWQQNERDSFGRTWREFYELDYDYYTFMCVKCGKTYDPPMLDYWVDDDGEKVYNG